MTKTDSERLTRMEDNQDHFTEAIKEIFKRLDKQDDVLNKQNVTLDKLNSKFDQITGGKAALMWVAGTVIALATVIVTWLDFHKHH